MLKIEIARLVSDLNARKQPLIEAEPFDDEHGDGYKPLDRWMDRLYRPIYDNRHRELRELAA